MRRADQTLQDNKQHAMKGSGQGECIGGTRDTVSRLPQPKQA